MTVTVLLALIVCVASKPSVQLGLMRETSVSQNSAGSMRLISLMTIEWP